VDQLRCAHPLAVGLVSAFLTMVIAVIVGGVAGYFGGWIDSVMMRITDVPHLAVPALLILISAYSAVAA
jgi:ABC-type dipeptide/oligopeptide/nickel transport system permease subunit